MKLSPEQSKLRSAARELAEAEFALKAAEIDRTEAYPYDNVAALKAAGFMGYTIPKAYGGRGGSYLEAALIIEEMARVCGATGRITVEANMGAISAVMQYGSEKQKRLAADLVLSGDKPAICITEPDAGSAATGTSSRAAATATMSVRSSVGSARAATSAGSAAPVSPSNPVPWRARPVNGIPAESLGPVTGAPPRRARRAA
jgi:alkylation response protein AidB-like acyl-CoA dehydrogenase